MNKHIDDTTYSEWLDGMYVMLADLKCDYELAVVEDSLRGSKYTRSVTCCGGEDCIGILTGDGDYWYVESCLSIRITREQALYIARGDTTCTTS